MIRQSIPFLRKSFAYGVRKRCFIRIDRTVSSASDNEDESRIIDVTDIAMAMRENVKMRIPADEKLKLVGVLANDISNLEDAELYSDIVSQTFEEDGIAYELARVTGHSPSDVEQVIREANDRTDVHGILVYYPIFRERNSRGPYKNRLTGVYYKSHDDYLRDIVCSSKDVEGLSHEYNARYLFRRASRDKKNQLSSEDLQRVVYPCTALSVYKILQSIHDQPSWTDTTVTIINRSEIMGRPLAAMLANIGGAHVYSVDADSVLQFRPGGRLRRVTHKSWQECLSESSIIVSGVPSSSFRLPLEFVHPGTTVVNVSEFENVCEEEILDIPGVKFIPQVGKVTVAALEQNLISLFELQKQK